MEKATQRQKSKYYSSFRRPERTSHNTEESKKILIKRASSGKNEINALIKENSLTFKKKSLMRCSSSDTNNNASSEYGRLPGRSKFSESTYIFDASISQCYDKINHDFLIKNVPLPLKYKHLLYEMLKTKILENNSKALIEPIKNEDLVSGKVYNKVIDKCYKTA